MLRDLTAWFRDQARADGWFSTLTGLGGSRDRSQSAQLRGIIPLTNAQIESLYLGSGLGGRIVDAVPDDAIGAGVSSGDEALDREIRRRRALEALGRAWRWGRAYGRGAVYLGLSDRLGPQDAPVALDQIGPGDLVFVSDVDGVDLVPACFETSRRSPIYGTPTHFYIGVQGHGTPVHASRFVFFGGAVTPDRIRQINLNHADLSVLQRPYEALRDEGISWAGVVATFQDLSQAVFAIKDLASMIASGQGEIAQARMEIVDMARSVARAVVIDADGERFEHVGAQNLTGVDPLIGRMLSRVASAAGMPATVLLGTAPVGMNATGESDLRIWYRQIETQRTDHEPQIATVFRAVARSSGIEWDGEIEWSPLWTPTAKEIAEVSALEANGDAVRVSSGVLSADEVALVRFAGADPREIVEARVIAPEGEESAEVLRPSVGETWIDTADQHRLHVAAIANGRVYFTDPDSETPDRQWSWSEATFVERARRMEPAAL